MRSPGADSCLEESDELYRIFDNTRMIQFGSFSMSREPMRSTMFQVLERYKGKKLIAYDPNLREMVWEDKEEMRRLALKGMEYADILKLGDDEAMLLTGQPDMESAVAYIKEHYSVSVLLVTLGRRGCKYYLGDQQGERPSYQVKSVDTTGAGDCFFGALLYQLLQLKSLSDLTIDQLGEFVTFANAAGAMSTTKKGTMDAMPGREEILACIQQG